jgi:hypothetical protein
MERTAYEELNNYYTSLVIIIIRAIKWRWAGQVARMGVMRCIQNLVRETWRKETPQKT